MLPLRIELRNHHPNMEEDIETCEDLAIIHQLGYESDLNPQTKNPTNVGLIYSINKMLNFEYRFSNQS